METRVGILCNSRLALPALQKLCIDKIVVAAGIPDIVHNATTDAMAICKHYGISCTSFAKKDIADTMKTWIEEYKLSIVLVLTFPYKIPEEILLLPKFGFVNFHFGLLPAYRGADAIFPQIKNREAFGGISIHKMNKYFDKGDLLHIEKIPILQNDTYGMHSTKLSHVCAQIISGVALGVCNGRFAATEQHENTAAYYKKPGQQDVSIFWKKQRAVEIIALLNACNPWNNGAYTLLNGSLLRIISATQAECNEHDIPGTVLEVNKTGIKVQCFANTALYLSVFYLEEGIYCANDFIKIFPIKAGDVFADIF